MEGYFSKNVDVIGRGDSATFSFLKLLLLAAMESLMSLLLLSLLLLFAKEVEVGLLGEGA